MKKKRLTLILTVLLSVLPVSLFADTVTSLVVVKKDKTTATFELATKPQVTFEGTDLKIIDEGNATTFIPLADIVRYYFETHDASGITEIKSDGTTIDYQDGVLVLSGLKSGTSAQVFSTDGRMVQTLTANYNGTFRLSLSSLPTGVYVVKVNDTTYKILKP